MSNPFVEETLEKLSILGNVTARAMFGGHGLYLDGVIFGLVVEDVLYLKVDDQTISKFQAAGGKPFTYDGKEGKPAVMSYWTFPSEVWESPEDLKEWGEIAYQAAVRSKPDTTPKEEPVAKTVAVPPKAKKSAPKKKAAKKKAKPAKKKVKVVAKKKAKAKKAKPAPKKSKKAVKKSSKKLVSKKKSVKKKPVKKAKAKKAAKKKKRSK